MLPPPVARYLDAGETIPLPRARRTAGNLGQAHSPEERALIERLALKVHQSGWAFDTILCLARGGMRPAAFDRLQLLLAVCWRIPKLLLG